MMADNSTMDVAPIQDAPLTPVAAPSPVRFVAPAMPANNGLQDLARGLSALDGGLSSLIDARQKVTDQADKVQAQADFYKNNSAGYTDAVASGRVPAFASPAYIQGYKETQGFVAGGDLRQKFNAAYDSWGDKNNIDDPNAYSKFTQDFLARNISTNDPAVLTGLMPQVHQMVDEGQKQHMQDLHGFLVNSNMDQNTAAASQGITNEVQTAARNGVPPSLDTMGAALDGAYSNFMRNGGGPGAKEDIANKLIDTVSAQARLIGGMNGEAIVSLLDRKVPGQDYTYAETVHGADVKLKTMDDLETKWRRDAVATDAVQKAADKQALGETQVKALQFMVDNPGKPLPDELIQQGSLPGRDPLFREHMASAQDTLEKNAGTSDPAALMDVNYHIINGGGAEAFRQAVNNGVFKNTKDMQDALTLVDQTQKHGDLANSLIRDGSTGGEIIKQIDQRMGYGEKDQLGNIAAKTDAVLSAEYAFRSQVLQYAAANPYASPMEQNDAVAKIGAGVLKNITQAPLSGTVMPGGQFSPPAGAPGMENNPFAPPPAPAPAPAAPAPTPAPVAQPAMASPPPPAPPADPTAVHAWLQTLPATQQAQLLAAAQRTGLPADQIAAAAYTKSQQGATPLPAVPPRDGGPLGLHPEVGEAIRQTQEQLGAAFNVWSQQNPMEAHQLQSSFMAALTNHGVAHGSYNMAAIQDNPKAAHILDFISGPESKGNYDAYIGHSNNTSVQLDSMSLNNVLAFQQKLVAEGEPSGAVGRYQFIHGTLAGLMKQLNLNGSEKFTPVMQDTLAIQLLKNRGFDKWQAGALSDNDFANNLSLEWASLPDVHTGRSAYDRVVGNKSLVTPQQSISTLRAASALPGQQ